MCLNVLLKKVFVVFEKNGRCYVICKKYDCIVYISDLNVGKLIYRI